MSIDARLAELGITLPQAAAPVAAYVSSVQAGDLLHISGQISLAPDGLMTGRLGEDRELDYGVAAARICGLNLIAQMKAALGSLDRVERVVKLILFRAAQILDVAHHHAIDPDEQRMVELESRTPAPVALSPAEMFLQNAQLLVSIESRAVKMEQAQVALSARLDAGGCTGMLRSIFCQSSYFPPCNLINIVR